jgi:sulfite reductase beta subunit-like hemoprotein
VQADARRLIARLGSVPQPEALGVVHLSGCEKGCARANPAPLTLVARVDATYDLYAGGADHRDTEHPRFGRRVRGDLTSDAAIEAVVASRTRP